MCNKSDSIVKIAAALVAFAGEVKSIEKDATNPHFKSAYTTLDHMIDETKPILHKHGLTIMQFPGGDGQKVTVRTMILHSSGEWIETEPLTLNAVKTDPQGAGSAITYGRRYSYAAALSLSLGDDDDGNGASTQPQKPPTAAQNGHQYNASNSRPQTPNAAPASSGTSISQSQIGFIKKLLNEKQISDDAYRTILNGYAVESSKDLTKGQASKLIEQLNAYDPQNADWLPF